MEESLFSRLFIYRPSEHRNPAEDFFTEIFAFLLENVDGLLGEILSRSKVITQGQLEITEVKTQCQFSMQSGDIRPDIFVRFSANNENWLLFIENKIDAREGERQLESYLDYLGKKAKEDTDCVLLYITQFYDPKKVDPPSRVIFRQLRWGQIYEFLTKFESNEFVFQARLYMKENGMSMSRNFSSDHLKAMMQWIAVREMMDESFQGPVEEMFKGITNGVKYDPDSADENLRDYEDYFYVVGDLFWVGIGYVLTNTIDKDYPDVGGTIAVEPGFSNREQVISALSEFERENDGWKLRGNPYDKKEAVWIEKLRSLKEFINSEDDIALIQTWFLEVLLDVEKFQKGNPHLPWDW